MIETESKSLIELFIKSYKENSEKIAIIDKEKKYTFKDIDRISNNYAEYLIFKHLDKKRIALYFEKSAEFIMLVIAIWKIGGSYIPIDTELPEERIKYILKDSDADCVIYEKIKLENYNAMSISLNEFTNLKLKDIKPNLKIIKNNDVAYIIYTSGSTGNPKGVQITNNNLMYFFKNIGTRINFSTKDIFLSITTVCFDISVLEMFLPLIMGNTLVVGNKRMLIDMRYLKETINKYNITVLQATPITWSMLLNDEIKISRELKVLCGGDTLEKELSEKLYENFDNVWNLYGPTETTIWSSVHKLNYPGDTSIGNPLNETKFYIFENNNNKNEGELYIGGKGLTIGYYNREDLNNEKFIVNPYDSTQKLYKTGDIVRFENGNYYCIGRNDFQIKINGHRIELEEIEQNLKKIKGIEMVLVVPDLKTKNIFAFVKSIKDYLVEDEIKSQLRKCLPNYMIPKRIFIVSDFIFTFNNKIDRKAMMNKYIYEVNDSIPMKTIEDKIVNIWSNIIGRTVDINSPYNMYDIDSLDLIQISIEMKKIFKEFSLDCLMKYKTIKNILEFFSNYNTKIGMRTKKMLNKYQLEAMDVDIKKINTTEEMMLNYYFLNPESINFQDCYIFKIKKINQNVIKKNYFNIVNNIKNLKTKYVFGENIKIYSPRFESMIKYYYKEFKKENELKKEINRLVNEVNNINEMSIKLTTLKYNSDLYLVFNYPHIRLDEISFFKIIKKIIPNTVEMMETNIINDKRNLKIKISKYNIQKIINIVNNRKIKVSDVIEYYIIISLKEQLKQLKNVQFVISDSYEKVENLGNNICVCALSIENINSLEDFLDAKKSFCEKKDNKVLISYNNIENFDSKNHFYFSHIENNDFDINVEIYKRINEIEILITLKNEKIINLEKIKEKFGVGECKNENLSY